MARILVTIENSWYSEIRSLKNYNEKSIENRILKYGPAIFEDFYSSLCNFTLSDPQGNTSDPDIILISKDFKRWVIVEVELLEKGLTHTFEQLDVFTNCVFDEHKLLKYLQRKNKTLLGHDTAILKLLNTKPEVLLIFDGYDEDKISRVLARYTVNVASIEVFRTPKHSGEIIKIYGDYPYQTKAYTFLKPVKGDFVHFTVSDNSFFIDSRIHEVEAYHNYKLIKVFVIRTNKKDRDVLIKIPFNPFEANKALILERTINNKYLLKPL